MGATRPFFLSGFCGGGGGGMGDGVRACVYCVICLVDFCHCCLVARCLFFVVDAVAAVSWKRKEVSVSIV